MNTDTETVPAASVNQSGRTDQSVAPAKKQAVGAKPKVARATKTAKTPRRPARSSRAATSTEKVVCRYCGSDDLAPSFRKRRDARCRACFKKRYGSAPPDKKAARTRRTKAAK
jgi:hypothetical protein